jgi:hypothetical protein
MKHGVRRCACDCGRWLSPGDKHRYAVTCRRRMPRRWHRGDKARVREQVRLGW